MTNIYKVISNSPVRLDKYLRSLFPNITQGLIEKSLRLGKIKVNGAKVKASLRVHKGDQITLNEQNFQQQDKKEDIVFSNASIKLANKILDEYLLYSGEYFIAINKPACLATQGGSKINLSIDDALDYLNYNGGDFKLVHRLDKETSGILLIAKNHLAAQKLTFGFTNRLIKKIYIAVVLGIPRQNSGEISDIIGKNKIGTYECMMEDVIDGKEAITQYRVLKTFEGKSLIEFTPLTGRTHQLRFHAQKLGCPIIGDRKYGNDISKSLSNKMLLHAKSISIGSDIFGDVIDIYSELPKYFTLDIL